jgi:large subunit ribosomal protein L4
MASQIFTLDAAKAAKISVVENGRYTQVVHDMVTALRANRRSGTAYARTRGEVAGSNKKLYRQKGTGNARAGERRTPTRSGGGVCHGPKQRDYTKKVSKKTRKLAFSKALSERIKAGDVFATNAFAVADGKTASFIAAINAITDASKVLVISAAFDEMTCRAARNHGRSLLMTADEANVEHLLNYHKIVITADALETLARRTA